MRRTSLLVQVVLLLGLWAGLTLFGRSLMLRDPGTFWHTATGERILETGQVERTDQYSCTCNGGPYLDSYWLAQCAMAGLYRVGGWDALLVATATLLATLFAALGGRLLRAGLHPVAVLLMLGLGLAASSHQFHVRPLVVTIVLTAWYFYLLAEVDYLNRPVWHLVWLIPATALWTNLHGGVLAGLGMLGLCTASWLYLGVFYGRGPCRRGRDMVLLCAIGVASLLAVAANPYGVWLPLSWWKTLSMPLTTLIVEHAPLDPSSGYGLLTVLLGAIYIVVWAGTFSNVRRVTSLVPLVWFVLGCLRVRNTPLFAVTALIAVVELLPHTHWSAWLVRHEWLRFAPAEGVSRWSRVWLATPFLVVGVAWATEAGGLALPLVGRGWARLDPNRWPVALLPELRAIESKAGTPVFNDMLFGGYLIFYTPGIRVFIDDRLELYGPFFLEYEAARWADPARIEVWRRRYGFRHALVESGSVLDRYLSRAPEWQLLKRCPPAALYMLQEGNIVGTSGNLSSTEFFDKLDF